MSLANLPALLENAEAGGYTVSLDPAQHGADGAFQFNQSYVADPEIGKWISNVDFRRALSLAVDRDAINEVIFLGHRHPRFSRGGGKLAFQPRP